MGGGHATTNTMLTIPIILGGQFDEFPSPSGPVLLLPMTAMIIVTLLIGWRARRYIAGSGRVPRDQGRVEVHS